MKGTLPSSKSLSLFFLLVSGSFAHGQVVAAEPPLPSLSTNVETGKPISPQLVDQVVLTIKNSIPFKEELHFLEEMASHAQRDDFERTLQVLANKYATDNNAMIQLNLVASRLYRDQFNNQAKSSQLLEAAKQIQQKVEIDNALSQLNLWNQLGEAYLVDQTSTLGNRVIAIDNFSRIVNFDSAAQPYFTRLGEFRKIQLDAALWLLSLTELHDIPKLHLPMFVYAQARRRYPKRAALLGEPLETYRAKKQLTTWLELQIKDEPKDSQVLPHLQASLNYLSK